jgi:hypothetical protein
MSRRFFPLLPLSCLDGLLSNFDGEFENFDAELLNLLIELLNLLGELLILVGDNAKGNSASFAKITSKSALAECDDRAMQQNTRHFIILFIFNSSLLLQAIHKANRFLSF